MREFIATLGFDEDVVSEYCETNGIDENDVSPGDFLEQEFNWVKDSGISLENWALVDEDVSWEQYLRYIVGWAISHNNPTEYEGFYPLKYDEWKKASSYEGDHFYVNKAEGRVQWLYYNPDSVSGGQFVSCYFGRRLLKEAIDEYIEKPEMLPSSDENRAFEVFQYIEGQASTFLADVGGTGFDAYAEQFMELPDAEGMTIATLCKLYKMIVEEDKQ